MKTLFSMLVVVMALSCTRTEKPAPVDAPRGPSIPAFDPSGVNALLNAHESPHADAEVWKRLGPAGHAYLRQLVVNEKEDVTRRMRAAEAMSFSATAEDVALLERLASDARQHELVRKGALTGMALGAPSLAAARLTPFVAAKEPALRARTIELLGALQTNEAKAMLRQVAAADGPEKNRAARALATP